MNTGLLSNPATRMDPEPTFIIYSDKRYVHSGIDANWLTIHKIALASPV